MVIYFLVFIISVFFSVLASKCFENGNKNEGRFFSLIAILIPSIMAGLRASSVGTDTAKYVNNTFYAANLSSNIFDALNNMAHINVEIPYKILNYVVSVFTDNVNWIYFILSFITLLFTYLACYDNRSEKGNYSLAYFSFLLLFFNRSLNLCRQSIAIAIILYSFKYVMDKKFTKCIFWCIIGCCFHNTAIMLILLYFLINFFTGKASNKKKFLVLIGALFFVSQYQNIFLFLINDLKLLDKRYLFYVTDYADLGTNMIIIELLFILVLNIVFYLYKSRLSKIDIKFDCYLFLLMLSFIIYLTGFYANYAFRISYYFYPFVIFMISDLVEYFKGQKQKTLSFVLILTVLFSYSYLYYEYNKFDETVPYKSIILSE